MSQIFFTADNHWHHRRILEYCKRPFSTVEEMDEAMIENWNSVVSRNDLVYHLGDFCFGNTKRDFLSCFDRLNGQIILIKGNHDKIAWQNRSSFLASYDAYKEVTVRNKCITLCHYSMRVWNKKHHGAWHLYGHSHGTLPDDKYACSIDVGVDCHNFTPISFDQVTEIMNKKQFRPIEQNEQSTTETDS